MHTSVSRQKASKPLENEAAAVAELRSGRYIWLHDTMRKRTTGGSRRAKPGSEGLPSTLPIYRALFEINQAFETVLERMGALREARQVRERQMQPFADMVREARAALNSHLTGLLETTETDLAGQLFRRRQAEAEESQPSQRK